METVSLTNERGQTREYETVASRLHRFRADKPDWSIVTRLIDCDDDVVRMEVEIGWIGDDGVLRVLASAHAEEYRTEEGVNATSALENCETSALGRALSFLGYGSPSSIASAEEVQGAKRKTAEISEAKPGALILLQQAAKRGPEALRKVWEGELSKTDRMACRGHLARLKREATNHERKDLQENPEEPAVLRGERERSEATSGDGSNGDDGFA